jgi:hypothetical protein
MASSALIIGISDYNPESELSSLCTAADDARWMAHWLIEHKWVEKSRIRLLCVPHNPQSNERPATRDSIRDALLEIKREGRNATKKDRLYFFYVGHGLGAYLDTYCLLLPQDVQATSYSEKAIPLDGPKGLLRWLQSTGFPLQFCFLDTCRHRPEKWEHIYGNARMPLEVLDDPTPEEIAQFVFYVAAQDLDPYTKTKAGIFSQVLREGLAGANGMTSVKDSKSGEQIVLCNDKLRHFLEEQTFSRSKGKQRFYTGGLIQGTHILAYLSSVINAPDTQSSKQPLQTPLMSKFFIAFSSLIREILLVTAIVIFYPLIPTTFRSFVSVIVTSLIFIIIIYDLYPVIAQILNRRLFSYGNIENNPKQPPRNRSQRKRLRKILSEKFNEEELRNICFDLDVNYENLEGKGNSSKARELVLYCERYSRIDELVAAVKTLRPKVDWNSEEVD